LPLVVQRVGCCKALPMNYERDAGATETMTADGDVVRR
jgi:hypothetical protein